MSIVLDTFKEICWRIARAIVILLILFGLAIAIPTLIAADSLSEWINDK
tara:strand:+ start:365 stop:511 length:147 start_codon:yes stop_codon:yes gene_type:complete